jgi:hypothetical protein
MASTFPAAASVQLDLVVNMLRSTIFNSHLPSTLLGPSSTLPVVQTLIGATISPGHREYLTHIEIFARNCDHMAQFTASTTPELMTTSNH